MHSNLLSSLNSHSCWRDQQFFAFEYAWKLEQVLKIGGWLKNTNYINYSQPHSGSSPKSQSIWWNFLEILLFSILSNYNFVLNTCSWKQELHNKSLQGCLAYFKINGSKIEVNHQKKKKKLDPKNELNCIKLYSLITRP